MRIRNLLRGPVVTAAPDDDLALAGQMMLWSGFRHLPVVSEGKLVGILSERGLLARRAEAPDRRSLVCDAMSSPVETISPEADVAEAATRLVLRKIGALPVVEEDGELIGIVTTTDLLARQVGLEVAYDLRRSRPIGDVMTPEPLAVKTETTLLDAANVMATRMIRHLPVVDGDRRVLGILSERDVRTAVGHPARFAEREPDKVRLREMRVGAVMTRNPLTVTPDVALSVVAGYFVDQRIGAIPVVDEAERLVGIVSYVDVIRVLK